jgi:arylsulfatase A-like enzyme/Flp pilus assembly protein TadD
MHAIVARVKRCALVLLLFIACAKRQPPPVILISIDTLRADYVTAARTPRIEALARDGIVFRNAWSHCPLTLPSHLSIFTGLLPPEHGVRDNSGYHFDGDAHATLASLLKARGYSTGAAVSAYVLQASTGASKGFEDYDDAIGLVEGAPIGALQRRGTATEKIAEAWIDAHRDEPFFYFLHLYEPHSPYEPTYDADVRAADAIAGAFLDHLKSTGVYDRALIVLLSDHGEGLMDHGEQEHGVFLYREDLHVPLIVKVPRSERRGSLDNNVQLVDVAPTILDLAGIVKPAPMHGLSLLRDVPSSRPAYAESFYPRTHLGWSELRSIIRVSWQAIDAPRGELYDLSRDPRERTNVIDGNRRAFAELRALARKSAGAFHEPERVDAEEAKKLAALGYVSGGVEALSGPFPDPKDVIGQLARLKSVEELRRRGDHRRAIETLTALLEENPRWSSVREQLGEEYEEAGDRASAARVYEEGIAATPRLAGSFALAAGFALLESGKQEEAAAHAQIALAAREPGAHLLLGEIAFARHDLDAASREAAAAESTSAEKSHALFLAARIAAARRDYARTLELLDAVQREGKATGASLPRRFHYAAADALARLNRVEEAEREFERAIAADPHDFQAYADLSLLQLIRGKRDDANATLTQLASMKPKPAVCLDIAKELETFGDRAAASVWRQRARVAR